MDILVVNCGSSSVKFAVVDTATRAQPVTGIADRLNLDGATLTWKVDGKKTEVPLQGKDHAAALRQVMGVLDQLGLAGKIRGFGHRVVHGGPHFSASVPVDAQVVACIRDCIKLAPLHNPPNLLGITTCQELFPRLPNVAVFDTAFHATMPAKAYLYPIPYELYEQHKIRRYGFHGTSHRFVAAQALDLLGLTGRAESAVITAHLGNGCSAAAVLGGRCVDTTMGLTPLEGLMMGTRSGDVDPALHGWLAENLGWDAKKTVDVLNKKSGLLGVSGVSNDMRSVLQAAAEGNARAQLAIDIFVHRLAKTIGALSASLGRLDAVVFTGGIGENNAALRQLTCAQLGALGIRIDADRNAKGGVDSKRSISPAGSAPIAMVIPTNEELMIALDTARIIEGTTAG